MLIVPIFLSFSGYYLNPLGASVDLILKPVNWFAQQIKTGFYMRATLALNESRAQIVGNTNFCWTYSLEIHYGHLTLKQEIQFRKNFWSWRFLPKTHGCYENLKQKIWTEFSSVLVFSGPKDSQILFKVSSEMSSYHKYWMSSSFWRFS